MTKFEFSLRRVLEFRRLHAHVARAALEASQAEREELRGRQRALAELRAAEEAAVREPGTSLSVLRLESHDRMQSYVLVTRERFAREQAQLENRIRAQRAVVVEADRQVGLLEKLEGRQQAHWQGLMDRELEELAADAYRSRAHRAGR